MTVNDVNEEPVGTTISPAELTAGNPITTFDLSEFFADPDGDTLTFTLLDDAESRAASAVVEDGSLTITPLEAGTASFAVTAADPSGLSVAITIVVKCDCTSAAGTDAHADTRTYHGTDAGTYFQADTYAFPDAHCNTCAYAKARTHR